jgi:integrase
MPQIVLTQELADSLQCPSDRLKLDFTDLHTRGLVLEIRRSGGKTYYVRYTDSRGKQRMYRLGDATVLTLAQSRKKCKAVLNSIAMGNDPLASKRALKSIPTFAEFIDAQYLPHVRAYKKSWQTDVSLLKNHLLPRFGRTYLDQITRQDIVKMHADRKDSGAAAGSANRMLIMMRYIFNLAIRWEVAGITTNPTKNVPLMPEHNKRERYLRHDEARSLYESVCRSANPVLKHIVAMLILTGCRKREVLDAKWEDFDFERRLWRIPTTKLGKPRHVPLSDGALSILTNTPRINGCPWVFANPNTKKPFISIFSAWDTARRKAGLADVRIHDLRHSFASLLINSGRSLYEVQKLLGHTQIKTTQRYAHLAPETLLEATNAATRAVGSVMGVMPNNVVDVPLVLAQG